jgi:hypothetical protein
VVPPVLVDVDDALEGDALVRALERHGLSADLVRADARWQVEVTSKGNDVRSGRVALGEALVRSSGAELGIAGTADGEVACPPNGDATALVATLAAADPAGEALRLRLRVLLLGAVWFELDRRRDELHLDAGSVAALARQSADRAYSDLLSRLGDYHGQSRFTTWAAKFAIHHAALAARRAAA